MRKTIIITLVLALAVVAVPSWARPFGHLDGLTKGANSATGVAGVVGWALDANGVRWVDIFVQDAGSTLTTGSAAIQAHHVPPPARRPVGRAFYGTARPGVSAAFPGFPDSSAPGFSIQFDTTQFFNGQYWLFARVTSIDGSVRWLGPFSFEIMNSTQKLPPFGEIDFPQDHSILYGECNLNDPDRRYSVVLGHALDVGVEANDLGVGYVELLIDGSIFANTKVDCVRDPARGGLTNCYGLPRLDIEQVFPTIPDAPTSGFRFVMDVGALIDEGYVEGRHVLTIRSGDISGQVANIDEIPVVFSCTEGGNVPSFGFIDDPRPVHIYNGIVEVTGWALDFEGVGSVRVYVNGVLRGTATYGIARPGIAGRYPGYPDSLASAFSFLYDTTEGPDGKNEIVVEVIDVFGRSTIIAERRIIVNNQLP